MKLSISDQQLPMFIRIMQLGIALYYGEIGNFKEGEGEDSVCHTKDMLGNITGNNFYLLKEMLKMLFSLLFANTNSQDLATAKQFGSL